jgi:hypothetical protein
MLWSGEQNAIARAPTSVEALARNFFEQHHRSESQASCDISKELAGAFHEQFGSGSIRLVKIGREKILTFNEAEGSQPVKEGTKPGYIAGNRLEAPDTISSPRLLRQRSEGPCDTRAEERYERASPHLRSTPRGCCIQVRTQQSGGVRHDVRDRSNARSRLSSVPTSMSAVPRLRSKVARQRNMSQWADNRLWPVVEVALVE